MLITIEYEIEREAVINGEVEYINITINATGDFYRGELEDWYSDQPIELTEYEKHQIEERLINEYRD